ncbi:unnamed protein product [Paramecium pentaurelia]|uniref:EGF-like domain-containing protein n=1 Tax=Paramecium pentaurelia TaxID=43138 RepID=A0A8S1XZV6_9CILI|nr:unnamed protein product [Paramecium pentaurelia]
MKYLYKTIFLLLIIINGKSSDVFKVQNKRIQEEVIENKWEPIRVQYQFGQENYDGEHKDFFQNLFSVTTTFITRYFLVQRSNEMITFDILDTQYFEERNISTQFVSQKFDADLLIFVVLITDSNQKFIASSTYFKTDPKTKRPTVGYITWNTFFTNLTNVTNSNFELYTQLLITVSMYVMGFHFQSFINYFDSSTNKSYPEVLMTQDGNSYLSTPRLTKKMKLHFNCSSINGAQLENEGGPNYELFHLERSLFYNEILTSSLMEGNAIISDFTFSLFQDTGFYNLMEYSPDNVLWGKNKGCDFFTKKCEGEFDEFCKVEKQQGCSFLNNGQSECQSDNYSSQCQYFKIKEGFDCKDKSSTVSDQNLETFQYFGHDSMCIQGSLSKSESAADLQQFSCYQYSCDSNSQLVLIIDQKEYQCLSKAEIQNKEYSGKLICPKDPEEFCKSQNECQDQCNQNGYCLNKLCICKQGYSGSSCQDNCSNFRYKTECFEICPKDTYTIESIKYCVGCPGNCQACQSYNKCTICRSGYKLNSIGFCDIIYNDSDSEEQDEGSENPVTQNDEQYLELNFDYEYENGYILGATIIYLILL